LLNSIKKWSLIPVQNEKDQTLSRIQYCQYMIVNPEQGNKFKFLNLIGVPVYDNSVFDEETNQFLLSINLKNNEDMLALFYKKKDNLKNLKDEDLIQICFLNDSLEIKIIHNNIRRQNEFYFAFKQTDQNFFEQDIKKAIKSLPIFKSILNNTENILNKTAYVIQSALCIDGLDLFCEANNIFLIDSKFDNLYEYLEVKHLTFDEFYIKFLTWASTLNNVDFLKQHLIIIKNNFGIRNEKIIELISQIRFVYTDGSYKRVNELYNHEKILFKVCFSHLFLPEEFSSEKNWPVWKDFMLKSGLKNKISMDDYLKTANTLKAYFHSKQIKKDVLMKYADLMFEEIFRFKKENQVEKLLENLKLIEFIPNYFTDEDLFQIHQFIIDSLERIQMNKENDIKNIIKSLPIFKSIFDKADKVNDKTVFFIEKQAILSMDDIDMFCKTYDIFLIDSKFRSDKLYEYLEVKHLTFDECLKKMCLFLKSSS
jgi:hypothetical protein